MRSMTHKRTAQYGKYCRLNTKQPGNKSYNGGVLHKQVFLAFALTSSCHRKTNAIGLFSKRNYTSIVKPFIMLLSSTKKAKFCATKRLLATYPETPL